MRLSHQLRRAAVCAVLLCGARGAHAEPSRVSPTTGYDYGDISTARALALGGAVRAFGNGGTGLYTNPANLAANRAYQLQGLVGIWPEAGRQSYGVGAVDSTSGRIAGGLGAQYSVLDPDGIDRKWTDIRLGLALPVSDKFFVGATGRYLKLRQGGPMRGTANIGGAYDTVASGLREDPIAEHITFDAGITVRPSDALSLGLSGTNLTNPGNGFAPTTAGFGIGYAATEFTVEGDVVADFTSYPKTTGANRTKMRAMLGFEYLAADHYPLRVGYRFDEGARTHAVSLGLGYADPQFCFEIGVRRTVAGQDGFEPGTAVVIDLQYFVDTYSGGSGSSMAD